MFKIWRSRQRTFVNSKIQGRIMGRIAAYWLLYHFVLWNGMFVIRYAQYRTAIAGGGEIVTFRQLYGQFCTDFFPLIVCALIILPAFLWDFARMTHRIAGPLIGFQHALRELRAGRRVEQVAMRKRDMLNEFQQEFNEFLKYYNARLDAPDPKAFSQDRMSEEQAVTLDEVVSGPDATEDADLGKTAVMIN